MAKIFTEEQMLDHARAILEEWLKGYTDPMDDRMQRRITILDVDDDGVHVRVERQRLHGGYDRQDKRFLITIEVKEE